MRLLCLNCREISADEDLTACPNCGNTKTPADADDTATVTITKHELRILTIWADNWARRIAKQYPDSPQVIDGIVGGLMAQGIGVALTFSQEVADLRQEFGGVQVFDSKGRELDL